MHPDDRSKFAYMLLKLNTAFDKKVSQVKADMYWDHMLDIPIELVGQAIERWIRDGRHFPKVAELRLQCDAIIAASANRKRIAGPPAVLNDEPLFSCRTCEDSGWRWHGADGQAISVTEACEVNARRVSPCECRATNPSYRARNPLPETRYGAAERYR